jgi:hypothetical protein
MRNRIFIEKPERVHAAAGQRAIRPEEPVVKRSRREGKFS